MTCDCVNAIHHCTDKPDCRVTERIERCLHMTDFATKPDIHVLVKTNYGNQTIYPNCESSKTFCRMLDQKTLTPLNIKYIRELGYKIVIDTPEVML